MLDRYYLRYRGYEEPVGVLEINIEEDIFSFTKNDKYTGDLPAFLFYETDIPMNENIKMWVMDRAPEPQYAFIDTLIEKAGLKEYDAYGFFKYNKGVFIYDKFYVEEI